MALPSSVTGGGAGTGADNITYTLAGVVDASGNPFYRDATTGKGIQFQTNNTWRLWQSMSATGVYGGNADYTSAAGQVNTAFPLSGWSVTSGAAPAITFTAGAVSVQPPTGLTASAAY